MSRAALALCATLAPLLLACARGASRPPSPIELRPGEDACAECRMFVTDPRFAVQVHAADGALRWFDDLGCWLAREEHAQPPEAVFVGDVATGAWVRGDQGFAVRVPGLDSPMGYGWAVHGSAAAAEAAARAHGARVVALPDLLRRGSAEEPPRADEAFVNPSR